MRLKNKYLLCFSFCFILLLSGCKEEPVKNEEITTVKPFTVSVKNYENSVSYSGYAAADELKRFSFELSGKINKVLVEKGDIVKAGQIIATLDTQTIQMAINNAKQNIALAQNKISQIDSSINEINIGIEAENLTLKKVRTGIDAEKISLQKTKETYTSSINKIQLKYDNAKETFENTLTLYNRGVCDKTTYDNAKLALDTVTEELENTKQTMEKDVNLQEKQIESLENDYSLQETKIKDMENKLEQANIQKQAAQISVNQAKISLDENTKYLSDSSLKSTIDGYVVETPMKSGEVTSAGTPVVVVKSGNEVVNVSVPTEDYGKFSVGMEARLTQDDKEIYGKITSIDLYPDETTRTYNIKITPSENNLFALGSLINVTISLDKETSVFIPINSIVNINGIDYVYCVTTNENGDTVVKSKEIKIKNADGENVCIEGLESGTKIVADEVKNLRENQKVNVKEGESVEK